MTTRFLTTHPGGDLMTTLTAPAPAVGPTLPPMSPLAQAVTLTVLGAVSGCLALAPVWHLLWAVAADVLGVSAGQVPDAA